MPPSLRSSVNVFLYGALTGTTCRGEGDQILLPIQSMCWHSSTFSNPLRHFRVAPHQQQQQRGTRRRAPTGGQQATGAIRRLSKDGSTARKQQRCPDTAPLESTPRAAQQAESRPRGERKEENPTKGPRETKRPTNQHNRDATRGT